MAIHKYLEYRTRPWNTGQVVYRKRVTGMTKSKVDALGTEADNLLDPQIHQSAIVTITGTRCQLPDVAMPNTPKKHNPYLNDNVS
jgi:hypothetical protein